jgi:predicted ArsR family transcriptional regulator
LALELRDIVEICTKSLSVAEVSAHLRVPLQVAKVLVGDLITSGDVESHSGGASQTGGRPDIQLLERVLEGLQSL